MALANLVVVIENLGMVLAELVLVVDNLGLVVANFTANGTQLHNHGASRLCTNGRQLHIWDIQLTTSSIQLSTNAYAT
jgi:hypothetical protein